LGGAVFAAADGLTDAALVAATFFVLAISFSVQEQSP
jgi:hypothetical protein